MKSQMFMYLAKHDQSDLEMTVGWLWPAIASLFKQCGC